MCDTSTPLVFAGNSICQSSEPLVRWQSRPCWPLHVDASLWRWRYATSASPRVRSPLDLTPAFILCHFLKPTTPKFSSQVWKTSGSWYFGIFLFKTYIICHVDHSGFSTFFRRVDLTPLLCFLHDVWSSFSLSVRWPRATRGWAC